MSTESPTLNAGGSAAGEAVKVSPGVRGLSGSGRDARLDALRGLMLVVIGLEHLGALAYNPFGFTSTAEGFVFLSGYVAGMVYGRVRLRAGQEALWRRASRRAVQIYGYHMAVFICLLAAVALGLLRREFFEGWVPLFYEKPWVALLLGTALTYQPTFLDILPMYCVFILLTPLVVGRFMRGQFAVVLALSSVAWVGSQLGLRAALAWLISGGLPINLGAFDVFGWQALFVFGILFGFRRCDGEDAPGCTNAWVSVLACVAVVVFFALRHDLLFTGGSAALWPMADKTELGPLRVADFAALAFLVGQRVLWPTGAPWVRGLAYLGRSSLQVFSFNIVCVYALRGLFGTWEGQAEWTRVVAILICMVALYLPAWAHQRWRDMAGKTSNSLRAAS